MLPLLQNIIVQQKGYDTVQCIHFIFGLLALANSLLLLESATSFVILGYRESVFISNDS